MDKQIIKVILGLKIKILREEQLLSLTELAQRSKISKSYLNEIENGKKYPKSDKLMRLANHLNTTYDHLVSLHFTGELEPVNSLLTILSSNTVSFNNIGMTGEMIAGLLLKNPLEASTFLLSFINLINVPSVKKEHLIKVSLAAHKQMHHNYFEHLEQLAEESRSLFLASYSTFNAINLLEYLKSKHHITISNGSLPVKTGVPAIWFEHTAKKLHYSSNKESTEAVYTLLQILYILESKSGDIDIQSPPYRYTDIEAAKQYFYSCYFARAIIYKEELIAKNLQKLFTSKGNYVGQLTSLLQNSPIPPAQLIHRIGALLEKHFSIKEFIIMRISNTLNEDYHSVYIDSKFAQMDYLEPLEYIENYCKRSQARQLLNGMDNDVIHVQRAQFHVNEIIQPMVIVSILDKTSQVDDLEQTHNLVIMCNTSATDSLSFFNLATTKSTDLGLACQSCIISDCKHRACEPYVIEKSKKNKALRTALENLKNQT